MGAVTLTVVANALEAEMLCEELRANGIKCAYETTDAGAAIGMAMRVAQAGPRAVLVDEDQLEEARKLLPADQ